MSHNQMSNDTRDDSELAAAIFGEQRKPQRAAHEHDDFARAIFTTKKRKNAANASNNDTNDEHNDSNIDNNGTQP